MISKQAIHEMVDELAEDRLEQLHDALKHITASDNGNSSPAENEPSSLTSAARIRLSATQQQSTITQAAAILDKLDLELRAIDRSGLPSFHLAEGEDDSLTIEWMFPQFRLGFSVEPDEQDSNWFFVSDQTMGAVNACGYLSEAGIKAGISLALHHSRV